MIFNKIPRVFLYYIVLLVFVSFLHSPWVEAQSTVFYDDFDQQRNSWKVLSQTWNVEQVDGNGVLRTFFSPKDTRSVIIADTVDSDNWGDYTAEALFFSLNGVDQSLWVRASGNSNDPETYSYYAVNLRAKGWSDSDNIRVKKVVNGHRIWMNQIDPPQIGCSIENNKWYRVKVTIIDKKIRVYVSCSLNNDPHLIFTKDDNNAPLLFGTIGLEAWSGSWSLGVDKIFDNVKVVLGNSVFPQTIIIPGLGGSWNTEAIVSGEDRPQAEWGKTPFVDIYDNLITTLTNAGAPPLVFYYDWRKPVDQSAGDLNSFINSHVAADAKVNLIGHSLGGLVARSYQQNYGGGKVNKLITLGSPHKGAVQAYEALAGGRITDRLSWDSVAKKLLLETRGGFYRTDADIVRQEIVSLKDIVPIFNFSKLGRRTLSFSNMGFANQWLQNLNSDFTGYQDKVEFIVGRNSSNNTPEWLILKSRSLTDRLLGLWPDGSLRRTVFGPGDGTILVTGAFLGQSNYQFNLDHRQLPSSGESIGKVMDLLDLNGEIYLGQNSLPRDDTLIFMIGSPATLQVTSPAGQIFNADNNGFVIIPHPASGEYRAVLTGAGSGRYHLVTGKLASADYWNHYQGITGPGQVDEYRFSVDFSHPSSPMLNTTGRVLEECIRDNRLLEGEVSDQRILNSRHNLENALAQFSGGSYQAENQSIVRALIAVFGFRRANLSDVRLKTTDLVDCQTEALVLSNEDVNANRSSAYRSLRKARRRQSLVNRIYRLKNRRHQAIPVLSAKSYHDGGQLVQEARSSYRAKSYPQAKAFSDVAYFLFNESLR